MRHPPLKYSLIFFEVFKVLAYLSTPFDNILEVIGVRLLLKFNRGLKAFSDSLSEQLQLSIVFIIDYTLHLLELFIKFIIVFEFPVCNFRIVVEEVVTELDGFLLPLGLEPFSLSISESEARVVLHAFV